MLRWIVVAMLGVVAPCVAEEEAPCIEECEVEAWCCLGYGYGYVLAENYERALVYFDKARGYLENEFCDVFIRFGQAVAYDALGRSEECAAMIEALFVALEKVDAEDVEMVTGGELAPLGKLMLEVLEKAPSEGVRAQLFPIADELVHEVAE